MWLRFKAHKITVIIYNKHFFYDHDNNHWLTMHINDSEFHRRKGWTIGSLIIIIGYHWSEMLSEQKYFACAWKIDCLCLHYWMCKQKELNSFHMHFRLVDHQTIIGVKTWYQN